MSRVEVGGSSLHLLPQKVAWWPALRTLLVADAHIGKAVSFRQLGVPVPRGTTTETLDRLGALIDRHRATRVIFLGDLLHSARAHAPATLEAFSSWRERHAGIDLMLVRGNHDDRAGDPPVALGVTCIDEPLRLAEAPGLALCHHPTARPGLYVLAGHGHPCMTVGRGIDRLRLPCFHFGATVGVLPAFGAFTGMHPVVRAAGDRVFVVADNAVHALPASSR